ncbi:MAG: SAM-dependent methyltransferase [Sulfurospirillum sp.]|nr:MAG: SAM-dependent methyltransferase [Sulfurospirillum sp.]
MKKQNWDASAYAKYSKGQEKWARELIAKLALKGDESILDLGCGDGKITAILAEQTEGEVVGVDKSSDMIALARDTYADIAFEKMDATQLSFEARFDLIFSNAVLHWVSDHRSVVAGLKRALKPGGKILLQFGGYGNAAEILKVMEEHIEAHYADYFKAFMFPYSFPHSDIYRRLLEEQGFEEISARLIPKDMVHDSVDAFTGWLRTTWFPYTDALPEEMRENFIEGFVTRYLQKHPLDENGGVHVDMVRLEVAAKNPFCFK